jgi:hypothetical protein
MLGRKFMLGPNFLECMTSLWSGLSFNAPGSLDVDTTLAFKFNEGWVRDTLAEKYETMFECKRDNPRTAPSRHPQVRKKASSEFYVAPRQCYQLCLAPATQLATVKQQPPNGAAKRSCQKELSNGAVERSCQMETVKCHLSHGNNKIKYM